MKIKLLFLLLLLPALCALPFASFATEKLLFGVSLCHPKPQIKEKYQPLVDYLTAEVKGVEFELLIKDFCQVEHLPSDVVPDLLLTPPRQYIIQHDDNKFNTAIASVIRKSPDGVSIGRNGGVIFSAAGREDVNRLADLKGKRIAVPGKDSLGGFLAQMYELNKSALPFPEEKDLLRVASHREVVLTVLSGQADVGFVRGGVLEQMSQQGELDLVDLKLIHRMVQPGFPYSVSTPLYPEWPVVALAHMESGLQQRIQDALLSMPVGHQAALQAGIVGFSEAASYHPVEQLARALTISPFDHRHTLGWADIWGQNRMLLYFSLLALLVIGFLLWLLIYRNRQLVDSRDRLTELLASQEAIFLAIPELMFEMDLNGRYLNVWARNPNELTTTKSLLLGRTVFDVMPLDQAERVMVALKEANRNGQSHGQQIMLGAGGNEKWFELSVSLKNCESSPHCFIVLSRDITDRIRSQNRLKMSEQRYSGLFEGMADGVAIFKSRDKGADFELIDLNPAGEKIEGLLSEDVVGKRLFEAFPGVRDKSLQEAFQRVLATGTPESIPLSFYADGCLTGWRENFIYRQGGGEIVAIFSDQTARKQAEQKLQQSESMKRLILDTIPDMMWLKDRDGIYMTCNPPFEQFAGFSEEEIIGKTDFDLVDAGLASFFRANDQAAMQSNQPEINEEWVTMADSGYEVLLETTRVALYDVNGEILGVLGIGHDITERHEAEGAARLSSSVFTHSQEGIIITDAKNRIIDANPACYHLTGYSPDELIGHNPHILSSGNQSREFYQQMWQKINDEGNWQGEIQNRNKSGEVYTERLSIDVVHGDDGNLKHYVGVFSDITYLKEQEIALERVAYSDALTGLPNRLLLSDRIQQAISQAERQKKMVAICYLDLDGFKPINDQHGHKAGDEVLIEVGKRLTAAIRQGDSVARLGGDEFVLLLLNLHSMFELEQMVDRVLRVIGESYQLSGKEQVFVSASVGIALYPLDDSEPDTLLRHADQAMYIAKKQGKNRYSFFDPTEERRAVTAHGLHFAIEEAIQKKEFVLYYQPKVNMLTGEVVGAEALIRWQHPVKGLLGPLEFLPVIEHSSLIVDVGNWVLRQALTQMRAWKAEGVDIKVSVNIAALQLQQHDFVSGLKALLTEFSDLPPSNLELEILETAALHDVNHVSQIMRQCEALGVEFALDDFGTGYSSLTYLKRLPAHVLKIDQSFIHDLLDDKDDVAITEGILGLSRAFNRTAIAEGVETVLHGVLLLNMGCELGQGYGIARPMPAEDFLGWVKDYKIAPEWAEIRDSSVPDVDISILMIAVEHHRLVAQVLSAVKNKAPALLPDDLQDAHACEFGKWLDSDGAERYGHTAEYQPLLSQHEHVHELCELAASQLINGPMDLLMQTTEQLKAVRNEVLDSLNRLRNLRDR